MVGRCQRSKRVCGPRSRDRQLPCAVDNADRRVLNLQTVTISIDSIVGGIVKKKAFTFLRQRETGMQARLVDPAVTPEYAILTWIQARASRKDILWRTSIVSETPSGQINPHATWIIEFNPIRIVGATLDCRSVVSHQFVDPYPRLRIADSDSPGRTTWVDAGPPVGRLIGITAGVDNLKGISACRR